MHCQQANDIAASYIDYHSWCEQPMQQLSITQAATHCCELTVLPVHLLATADSHAASRQATCGQEGSSSSSTQSAAAKAAAKAANGRVSCLAELSAPGPLYEPGTFDKKKPFLQPPAAAAAAAVATGCSSPATRKRHASPENQSDKSSAAQHENFRCSNDSDSDDSSSEGSCGSAHTATALPAPAHQHQNKTAGAAAFKMTPRSGLVAHVLLAKNHTKQQSDSKHNRLSRQQCKQQTPTHSRLREQLRIAASATRQQSAALQLLPSTRSWSQALMQMLW
jgi:hypothetical protein